MRNELLGVLAAVMAAAGCAPSQTPAPAAKPALSVGPLTYFQAHCARCHGPYGSFYAIPFKSEGAALITKIEEMARGPGGLALAGPDLDAQVAFHQSLRRAEVFLAITGVEAGTVHGEVSPGTTVTIVSGGTRIEAKVDGHVWSCALDNASTPWTVEATQGEKTKLLDPRRSSVSSVGR